jgi:hypothetical protein
MLHNIRSEIRFHASTLQRFNPLIFQLFNIGLAMLAVSLDNFLFLLLLAAAALFQLLSKALTKGGKKQSEKPSTPPRLPQAQGGPTESDGDRVRKLLEALGQPPTSTPPAPVAPRSDVPPRPLAPVQPPPVVIPRAWGVPREKEKRDVSQRKTPPPGPPRRVELVRPKAPLRVAPAFEVRKGELSVELEEPTVTKTPVGTDVAAQPIVTEADFKIAIAALLKSKSGLQQAIILHEIFGPPRGVQGREIGM